jgi:hypothetical protein
MMTVYLLWHTHEFENGDDDAKLIGIYASQADADEARTRVAGKPGFRDHPEGFEISPYEVGQDHWTEGYVTV